MTASATTDAEPDGDHNQRESSTKSISKQGITASDNIISQYEHGESNEDIAKRAEFLVCRRKKRAFHKRMTIATTRQLPKLTLIRKFKLTLAKWKP
jgi:hypothetical protein